MPWAEPEGTSSTLGWAGGGVGRSPGRLTRSSGRAITPALQGKGGPDSQTRTHACRRFRRTRGHNADRDGVSTVRIARVTYLVTIVGRSSCTDCRTETLFSKIPRRDWSGGIAERPAPASDYGIRVTLGPRPPRKARS
eukprot:1055894-Prymnesium_polylepis.1